LGVGIWGEKKSVLLLPGGKKGGQKVTYLASILVKKKTRRHRERYPEGTRSYRSPRPTERTRVVCSFGQEKKNTRKNEKKALDPNLKKEKAVRFGRKRGGPSGQASRTARGVGELEGGPISYILGRKRQGIAKTKILCKGQ